MSSKVRIGQIGVGYWGPNLLRNAVAQEAAEVAKVADLSAERRDFVKERYPLIEVCDSAEAIFEDASVDAVMIATPAATHAHLALEALRRGKHVLVEKPLATSLSQLDAIAAAAHEKSLVAMVGHTFLYDNSVRYLKRIIDEGELGQIRYLYSQRLNLGRIRSDVDALWNFGPHDISIFQYLLGDPTPLSVQRHGMSYVQRGIDDVVFLNIKYPNKVLANIHVSWLDPQRVRRMVIVGSEKMAIYDDTLREKVKIVDKGIDRFAVLGENMDYDQGWSFNHRSGCDVIPEITNIEPLFQEVSHFLDCIQNGTECVTGVHHARRVLQILQCSPAETAVVELGEANILRRSEGSLSGEGDTGVADLPTSIG